MTRISSFCPPLVTPLCLLLVLGVASPALATPQLFQSSALVFDAGLPFTGAPLDGQATGVAAGDLDGDGRSDLVVTHLSDFSVDGRVSVLLSTNHPLLPPLFRPEAIYLTDDHPMSVRLADVDGDGDLDILVSNENPFGTISVLLGTGTGSFAPHVDYSAGAPLSRLVVADFSGDGVPDVAATYASGTKIAVLLGIGGGAFGAPTTYGAGGVAVAVGDVNGDGTLDLISGGAAGSFDVLPGLGGGVFGPPITWPTASTPQDILVKDMDGDGTLDVVIAAFPNDLIQVHLNAGGGNFGLGTAYNVPSYEGHPSSLAMADMNGDAIEDLVVGHYHLASNSIGIHPRDATGMLRRPAFFDGGSGIWTIAVGDFNGDGHVDVGSSRGGDLVVGGYESSAYVLLGNGDATLGQGAKVSLLGTGLFSACSGDFNRDGRPDLAMTTDAGLEVRLGFGNATYSAPTMSIPTLTSVVTGDLNRDGKLDIVTNDASGLINTRIGLGDGTFVFPSGIVLGYYLWPRSLVDINRDGNWDLVLRGSGGFIYTMMGNGAGGFITPPTAVPVAGTPNDFSPGDWNRDGRLDLAVATSNGVSLLIGNGLGGFASGGTLLPGTNCRSLHGMSMNGMSMNGMSMNGISMNGISMNGVSMNGRDLNGRDLNGRDMNGADLSRDGKPDLAVRSRVSGDGAGAGSIKVLLGDGVGGFPTLFPIESMHRDGIYIDSWDVNRDGSPDLVADEPLETSVLAGDVSLGAWLGNGIGFMAQRSNYLLGHAGFVGCIQSDLDGQPDVIGHTLDEDAPLTLVPYAAILRGNAPSYPGTLGGKTDYATALVPRAVATDDLNRDGNLDWVAVSNGGARITVHLGNGLGTFTAGGTFPVALNPFDIVLADFNRDGIIDCATVGTPSTTQIVSVLLGVGDGTFLPKTDYLPGPMSGDDRLVVADVNRDGAADLVTSGFGDKAYVLLGNGGGGFGVAIPYSYPGTLTHRAQIADMNRDGYPDLVTTNGEGASLSVSLGNGTGTFGAAGTTIIGDEVYPLAIADFNRDGSLDVAAGARTGAADYVIVLLGNGLGGFSSSNKFAVPINPMDIAVMDGNGDGIVDFAVSSLSTSQLSLLFGTGTGAFSAAMSYASASQPVGITVGDYDHNGHVDFATANQAGNNVSVFLNSDFLATAVASESASPSEARLLQNAPNPFNPRTTIRFALAKAGHARVIVFDVAGRRVATLLDGNVAAGAQKVEWDGMNAAGQAVASGVYYYRLEAPGVAQSRSMVLLR